MQAERQLIPDETIYRYAFFLVIFTVSTATSRIIMTAHQFPPTHPPTNQSPKSQTQK